MPKIIFYFLFLIIQINYAEKIINSVIVKLLFSVFLQSKPVFKHNCKQFINGIQSLYDHKFSALLNTFSVLVPLY